MLPSSGNAISFMPLLLAERPSEDCGCPEQDWDLGGVFTTIHLEEDGGGGHILFDNGDWEAERRVDCSGIDELLQLAIDWRNTLPAAEDH